MSARDEVLGRIRAAIGASDGAGGGTPARAAAASAGEPGPSVPAPGQAEPGCRVRRAASPDELLDLLTERLTSYRATVRRSTPDGLAAAIGETLARRGIRRVVVPPGLDLPELPPGTTAVADARFTAQQLDGFDGAITAATVAIAETGTIVLDGSADQGRRAISLVPDYHLCIVRADQIVACVPEAFARLHADRPLTWISGPSATSDIELERVEGVHGPRTLEVILLAP